jgi:hypothetical protein
VIYLFLSVAAVCASALLGFRMYLKSAPACSRDEYEALKAELHKAVGRVDKLAFGSMGKSGR